MSTRSIAHQVFTQFQLLNHVRRCYVAYSGGVDSHVLLYLLSTYPQKVRSPQLFDALNAVHIHHGLSPNADTWAEHCKQVCSRLNVPLQVIKVQANAETGESPEEKARQARYHALRQLIGDGDCLLTAHHEDDQVETMLLQLLRGAGPKGLAAMPVVAPFGKGMHARPMLTCSREEIHSFAVNENLQWMDDESNMQLRFDRNFLRHQVLPLIQQRWPGFQKTVARSSLLCAQAAQLIDEQARADFKGALDESKNALHIGALRALGEVRLRNAVRAWLNERGINLPAYSQLTQIVNCLINARIDAEPKVQWHGYQARRYRDRLYVHPQREFVPPEKPLRWNVDKPMKIGGQYLLYTTSATGRGIAVEHFKLHTVWVGFRCGGEKIKPEGRCHTNSLKKLFQQSGVPPWERNSVPLIYFDNELAAVGEYFVSDQFAAQSHQAGYIIGWKQI